MKIVLYASSISIIISSRYNVPSGIIEMLSNTVPVSPSNSNTSSTENPYSALETQLSKEIEIEVEKEIEKKTNKTYPCKGTPIRDILPVGRVRE